MAAEQLLLNLDRPSMIGVCGYSDSGKSTFGIQAKKFDSNIELFAFATPIKKEVATDHGITADELELDKESYREDLQIKGEQGRHLSPSCWIDQLDAVLAELHPTVCPAICDVRHTNEADYIESKGGIIVRVIRVDQIVPPESQRHISEHPDKIAQDYTIYTGGEYWASFPDAVRNIVWGKEPNQEVPPLPLVA